MHVCTCTAQIIQRLPGSFPTYESTVHAKVSPSPHFRQGQNSHNVLQEPCDVFWDSALGTKSLLKQREASQPALYRQTTPLGGPSGAAFPTLL